MYYAGLEHLTPGKSFAEFMDMINGFGERRGMKSQLLMHGRGYGDDGPLFTPQNRGGRNRDVCRKRTDPPEVRFLDPALNPREPRR